MQVQKASLIPPKGSMKPIFGAIPSQAYGNVYRWWSPNIGTSLNLESQTPPSSRTFLESLLIRLTKWSQTDYDNMLI